MMRKCSNQQKIRQFGPQIILRMNNESTGTSNTLNIFGDDADVNGERWGEWEQA
jgi:hypothetical protein